MKVIKTTDVDPKEMVETPSKANPFIKFLLLTPLFTDLHSPGNRALACGNIRHLPLS